MAEIKEDYTIEESDITLMHEYLAKCHQSKALNDDQYNFYVNQLLDGDDSLGEYLETLNLWKGFLASKTNHTQQQHQAHKLIQQQKQILQETIQKHQMEIQELQTEIPDLQQQLEALEPAYHNAKSRSDLYPDNPRLRATFEAEHQKYHPIHQKLESHKAKIERLATEIQTWKEELTNL